MNKDITIYSEQWPGSEENYSWPVRFDITNGVLGITQGCPMNELPLQRVLLSKRQVKELRKFLVKK